jgi:hypothetical protein
MPSKSRRILSSESDSDHSPTPPPTRKHQSGFFKPDEANNADMDVSDRVQNTQNSTYFFSLVLITCLILLIDI